MKVEVVFLGSQVSVDVKQHYKIAEGLVPAIPAESFLTPDLCGARDGSRPPVDLTSPPATSSGGSPETTAAASLWVVQKQAP